MIHCSHASVHGSYLRVWLGYVGKYRNTCEHWYIEDKNGKAAYNIENLQNQYHGGNRCVVRKAKMEEHLGNAPAKITNRYNRFN
ncbi:hypothetical protein PRIPAC_96563 [Pristionchus pacificus]|uniref:Uncharacterized protein n=1 Tax=Pristionchus pacificus TaxID=54126 RepID=A0A2A6D1F0_PRIPA|nr:hypothetical protein PRIPAC_96563 [Pristionchus pacificus]|eukprot:PDM84198.1 hypothetical protein PRIPAC_33221 [Pristionchus pacificus]